LYLFFGPCSNKKNISNKKIIFMPKNNFNNFLKYQQNLLTIVPEIVMEVDNNKIYTWANKAGLDFFGKDVIGKEARHYFVGEQKVYQKVSPLFKGDENIFYVESWQRRKDKEARLLAWWCRVLKDEKNNVRGALSIARDITKEKEIEEKLAESEQKYRRLFEAAKDSILILDADNGEIRDSNPFLQSLLGYSAKELIGKKIFQISPFKDIIENKEKFLELKKKGYVYYSDLPLKTKSGIIKQVEFISNTYFVGKKKVIQCNIRDITERIRTERQLDQAKNDFLSLASHQLRAPLSAMKWVLESLMNDPDLTIKQKDKIGDLIISNKRLINLVNRVLNVTRIESGKLLVNKKLVDIKKLINNLVASFKILADNNKKKIKIVLPSKLKRVYCDPVLINEALGNLLKNAIDYSGNNSEEIRVSARERKFDYLISIHDYGVIDPLSIKNMNKFSKFIRGSEASDSQSSGSGLGLYITKKIIEASGGNFWFKSDAKSRTTFYLTIVKKKLNNKIIK
jgi:PAS domain S-box-containing protein